MKNTFVDDKDSAAVQGEAEIDSLRTSTREYEKQRDEAKAERDAAVASLDALRRQQVLQEAASKFDFHDRSQAVTLAEKYTVMRDGQLVVVDEQGHRRLNSQLSPMTPAEFLAEIAARHAYLVRGGVQGQVTSSPSQGQSEAPVPVEALERLFGKKANTAETLKLKRSNPTRYEQLRQQAVKERLIPDSDGWGRS